MAGGGGLSSFALGDLTRSLQIDGGELPSSSNNNYTNPSPASLSHQPQQHSEWYRLHPPSGLKSSLPATKIKQEPLGDGGGEDDDAPDSKKRKRNKPTLSCKECVDKKMKASLCSFSSLPLSWLFITVDVELLRSGSAADGSPASSNGSKPALFTHKGGTDLLLSHAPYSETRVSSIFGIGAEYPFSNYWTQNGGVSEVLNCFPNKKQADILVDIFFEAVDPVYPMISRERFYIDYEGFWELNDSKRLEVDIDFIALVFMILAMGTQFLQGPDPTGQVKDAAEFYSSACYQSLRLFSYLNRTSVRCLQSMVFMTYFLLNSGRASDGWAFSGTLIRQAYAGGINREPMLISPKFTKFERLERRRLWHGIVCQDSFMSMSLRLPPTAIHFDVDNAVPMLDNDETFYTDANLESASEDLCHDPSHSDIGYVQSMYSLALLAQETISTPRSLSLPMASTPRQRNMLLARFRACYRSFPDAFRAWDEDCIAEKARQGKKRLIRQIMFLTGLYWHCMTLIHSEGLEDFSFTPPPSSSSTSEVEKSPAGNVDVWIRGTLDAAYQSMRAFFVIHAVLGGESSVWWAFCHRAFSVSVLSTPVSFGTARYVLILDLQITVADLLKKHDVARSRSNSDTTSISSSSKSPNQNRRGSVPDCWGRARDDVHRMLDLLKVRAQTGDQSAKTRVEVLSNYL
ncbi:hypothetical protein UA08_05413 [Talaromyces atroroseus]|uniref:Xylanolytic transcriptional activator regulatory domain-containing protein n=1 Tax=Talaromyces atroroseus TaxID=1441469 RepID=A0A225AUL2_TALAT|nr:hypothetical protein UA08_05413 [Talaromyces atroroseus]OKL59279.1 hypothetical protein UA08_05413 [Talaromyces atroroseus]